MSLSGSAELAEAINTAWDASTLDADFTTLWADGESDRFNVLSDDDGAPEQPFPYCVFSMAAGSIVSRMSFDGLSAKQEVRDIPVTFTVWAKDEDGDGRTGKKIAADLIEKVMKVFGGHPTDAPDDLTLDNATHLNTQYVSDFPLREDDSVWSWTLNYLFTLDVPVTL